MQNMSDEQKQEMRQYGLDLIADRERIIRQQEEILADAQRHPDWSGSEHDSTMATAEIKFRQEEIEGIRAKLAELE